MRATKLGCLLVATAVAVALGGCAETAGSANSDALTQQLCTESDLGGHYGEKTSGTFSVQNLADLSDHPSARAKQLKDAGLKGGKFAYWVHTVPNPPFKPPLEVVCQAMAFGSAQEANAFVEHLKPSADDLASSAMTWLPDEHRTIEEIPQVPGSGQDALHRRTFRIEATGTEVHFTIYVVFESSEQYVRTVYLGNNGSTGTLETAAKIASATAARVR